MDTKKTINRKKPNDGANGQYNYDNGILTGIRSGDELYSLSEHHGEYDGDGNPISGNVLALDNFPAGTSGAYGKGRLEITFAGLRRLISKSTNRHRFRLYFFDDALDPDIKNGVDSNGNVSSYNIINAVQGEGHGLLFFDCTDQDNCAQGSGYNPTSIIPSSGLDGNGSWNGNVAESGIINDFPFPTNADPYASIGNWEEVITTDRIVIADEMAYEVDNTKPVGNYYIGMWSDSKFDGWTADHTRKATWTIYRLPKRYLWDLWVNPNSRTKTFKWGGTNDSDVYFPRPSYKEGGSGDWSPQWAGGNLAITITGPPAGSHLSVESGNVWIDDTVENPFYFMLNPTNGVDWFTISADTIELAMTDFRPISFVNVKTTEFDLQSFYTYPENQYTSAPGLVELSFRIAENLGIWFPNYIGYNPNDHYVTEYTNDEDETVPITNQFNNLKFKFFVVDWESDNMEFDWDEIIDDFPVNISEMWNRQRIYDTYSYQELYNSDGTYNTVEHQYTSPGVKIVKAIVFSYNEIGNHMQALRWKMVSIKLFLNLDSVYIEDFADLGGADFSFIPWPDTVPIIGGISKESQYYNSVTKLVQKNLFNESELLEEALTYDAYENMPGGDGDELGDSIGKVDISQVRYFTKPYTMNDLLMLPEDGGFYRYDDFEQWYSYPDNDDNPQYPSDSCVGQLFINDNENKDLRDNCIMELNFDNVTENNMVRDSSGNGFKSIFIGDYSLNKTGKGQPIVRDTSLDVPSINNEEKSF
tara:strand:- start:10751 stop:13018 length:2268 start_codon:yes stop_codon:yes gene_type:complete